MVFFIDIDGLVPRGGITNGYNFGIHIEIDYARKLAAYECDKGLQARFQEKAVSDLLGKMRYQERQPFAFCGNSLLVGGFYLDRGNGIWLTADNSEIRNIENPESEKIKFYSHNVDVASDAYSLLSLVTIWSQGVRLFVE